MKTRLLLTLLALLALFPIGAYSATVAQKTSTITVPTTKYEFDITMLAGESKTLHPFADVNIEDKFFGGNPSAWYKVSDTTGIEIVSTTYLDKKDATIEFKALKHGKYTLTYEYHTIIPVTDSDGFIVEIISTDVKFTYNITVNELTFSVNDNGTTAAVTGHEGGIVGDLAIPASTTINGTTYPVTVIGKRAFYNCDGMTSVTIPNSVTTIGEDAFLVCNGLTSVTIPNSVITIGAYAFSSCKNLTSVILPTSVTSIGEAAFSYCRTLEGITIPASVTNIGYAAFSECSALTSIVVKQNNPKYDSRNNCEAIIETATNTLIVGCKNTTFPNSVTSIGDYAFSGCNGLTSVSIPRSITSIGFRAFSNCTSLTSLSIPSSVTSIVGGTSSGCTNLTSIWVEEGNPYYASPNNCNAIINTNTNALLAGCKTTVIPNSVTSIDKYAFYRCTGLTSVTIPRSVSTIYDHAFSDCTGLTSINIPASVTFIGHYAFSGCSGLTRIDAYPNPAKVSLGSSVFDYNVSKDGTLHVLPHFLCAYQTADQWKAFTNIAGDLEWENVLTYAVNDDGTTATVTGYEGDVVGDLSIPATVTISGTTYPVTVIGGNAFSGTSLTSVTIPNSVTTIGWEAFGWCTGLTSVVIPNSVTSIKGAFKYCTGLTSVTIPNSLTVIGWGTFESCSGLTNVTIPNAVTEIGGSAFESCSGLTSIDIPNSVTAIGSYAFRYCSGLSSVTIPNSVVTIGQEAFEGTAWYSNQPDGLVYAGLVAYKYKGSPPSGTSIVIKDGTKSIGYGAFYGCSGLTCVTIPASVTTIGHGAFRYCTGLTRIDAYPDPAKVSLGSFVFYNVPKDGTLHVLPLYLSAYQTADQWEDFFNIKADLKLNDTLGDVNGDGVVSGADVTGLYNMLLDGTEAGSGADVTALYNLLLK